MMTIPSPVRARAQLVLLLAGFGGTAAGVGCGDDAGSGDTLTCSLGTEACPCLDGGLCVAGLVCASGLCVDLAAEGESGDDDDTIPKGPDLPGDGDGDGDGDEGDFGSCLDNCGGFGLGGDQFCACSSDCELFEDCCPDYELVCEVQSGCGGNWDCAAFEVCQFSTGECVHALSVDYRVYVYWQDYTPDCFDTGLETGCLADVYMQTRVGGELVEVSETYHDVTQVTFHPVVITPNGVDGLSFAFWDHDDLSSDDFLNAVCVGSDVCGPLTEADLHTGWVVWDFSQDPDPSNRFYVDASFVAQ